MIMLTVAESAGCRDILQRISDEELFALNDTVTKRQVTVQSRKEAVAAILSYTESPQQFLRRQKVKRDLLFQYLVDIPVVISVASDKNQVVDAILKFWGSIGDNEPCIVLNDDLPEAGDCELVCSDSPPQINKRESRNLAASHFQDVAQNRGHLKNGLLVNEEHPPISILPHNPHVAEYVNMKREPPLESRNQPTSTVGPHSSTSSHYRHSPENLQQYVHSTDNGQSLVSASETANNREIYHNQLAMQERTSASVQVMSPDSDLQQLGEQFVSWFFEILNSNNPHTASTPEDFSSHHFWSEAKFTLHCITDGNRQEQFVGATMVSQRFLAFVQEELLLFNPNVSAEGIQVKSEPHGLHLIMVCGTLHRQNECLGLFEQTFGIIRDPLLDNNWKIKTTQLRMQSTQVTAVPKLTCNESLPALMQ